MTPAHPAPPPLPEGFESPADFLASLAHTAGGFIAYVDTAERVRFASRQLAEWFGHTPQSIVGRTLLELHGAERYAQFSDWKATEVRCGASVGVSLYLDHARDPAALIASADEAMYRIKNAG